MLGNIGMTEWIIVLVIILIFFGPKNLPKLAQSIGKSVRELKNGLNGLGDDLKESLNAPAETTTAKSERKIKPAAAAQTEEAQDDQETTTTA